MRLRHPRVPANLLRMRAVDGTDPCDCNDGWPACPPKELPCTRNTHQAAGTVFSRPIKAPEHGDAEEAGFDPCVCILVAIVACSVGCFAHTALRAVLRASVVIV